uniref:Tegument protein n=1 Tax=Otarine gammaherpesvirus 4 TaxID=2801541 RepID=A0A889IW53_9GAMA|nr:Tegument protein [Otarine gammaherpesvirus 4]
MDPTSVQRELVRTTLLDRVYKRAAISAHARFGPNHPIARAQYKAAASSDCERLRQDRTEYIFNLRSSIERSLSEQRQRLALLSSIDLARARLIENYRTRADELHDDIVTELADTLHVCGDASSQPHIIDCNECSSGLGGVGSCGCGGSNTAVLLRWAIECAPRVAHLGAPGAHCT